MIFLITFKEVGVFVICHLSSIQSAYHSLCHCVLGCLSRQPYAQILVLVLNNEMTVIILPLNFNPLIYKMGIIVYFTKQFYRFNEMLCQ